jgi:hypothetical protein
MESSREARVQPERTILTPTDYVGFSRRVKCHCKNLYCLLYIWIRRSESRKGTFSQKVFEIIVLNHRLGTNLCMPTHLKFLKSPVVSLGFFM